jgi:hypothetical protein
MLWLLFLPSVTCDNNPCENNGDCDEENGGYKCVCGAGYSGTNCEIVGIIISVLLIICKIFTPYRRFNLGQDHVGSNVYRHKQVTLYIYQCNYMVCTEHRMIFSRITGKVMFETINYY